MNYKPTDKMKNGAIVIDFDEASHVVLANFNGDFVTWLTDSEGHAYWGHYFDTVTAAVKDFVERVEFNTPTHTDQRVEPHITF